MKTTTFLTLFVLLLMGCKNEEKIIKTSLLNNNTTSIQIGESSDHINIYVESFLDTIDQSLEEFPDSDFCSIGFDVNGNSQIDRNLDFGFSSQNAQYDICDFYFRDSITVSPCGVFDSGASFDTDFGSSELSETPHMQWHLAIPKRHFEGVSEIRFVVKVFEPIRYRTYPEDASFSGSGRFAFDRVLIYER